jgi:Sel1 repeat
MQSDFPCRDSASNEPLIQEPLPDLNQLRLLITEDMSLQLENKQPGTEFVTQKLAANLWLVCEWNTPEGRHVATEYEAALYCLSIEQMVSRAKENTLKEEHEVEIFEDGSLLIAQNKDSCGVTLLLDDGWCDEMAAQVKGELLACLASPGVLLLGGTGQPNTVNEMHDESQRFLEESNRLSNAILVWRDRKWHEFSDIDWYLKAAEAGDANAMLSIAERYEFGRGVPQDYERVALWVRKAADAGNARAAFVMGMLYWRGIGVAKNIDKARTWCKKAANMDCEHFSERAKRWLGAHGRKSRVQQSPTHIVIEEEWMEEQEPRQESEIADALRLLEDQLWYNRHMVRRQMIEMGKIKIIDKETNPAKDHPSTTILRHIWEGALKAAAEVEKKRGLENLGPWSDFEWGMISGKISALRWLLGDEWDNLDT